MENHEQRHNAVAAEQTAAKRRYEPPAVLSVESLEAVAVACDECAPGAPPNSQALGKQAGPTGCCITSGS